MKKHEMHVTNDATASDGVLTWWELHGTIAQERLLAELERSGLGEEDLPRAPSDRVALRRAVESVVPTARVRPAPDGTLTAVDEHFEEGADGVSRPVYTQAFTVWLDDEHSLCFDRDVDDSLAHRIADAYAEALQQYTTTEVSAWLSSTMGALNAVAVRDSGGVYFVPRTSEPFWRARISALHAVSSCRVSLVPVARSADAARAIVDAVIREALKEAEALRDEATSGKLGARALQTRVERCNAKHASLAVFEDIFNTRLQSLHETYDEISAALTVAMLSADGGES